MANTVRTGFRPVKNVAGDPYDGIVNMYFIPATDGTAVFKGDLVKLAGSADSVTGVATVAQAAATNVPLVGVVVGFAPDPTNLNIDGTYRKASTARYVYVADDPEVMFEGTPGASANLGLVDVGLNAECAVAAGSTTTGFSGMTVDAATKAATATLALKIIGLVNKADNDNTANGNRVIVKINAHTYGTGTGAAGL